MFIRGSARRLLLGPIVGHTDHTSSRIWIRVPGDPEQYFLRVKGKGTFPFRSTEGKTREFGTGIAVAEQLRAGWQYRYDILHLGRVVPGSVGSFRTMPSPGSMADVLFASLSCSTLASDLATWNQLAKYITEAKPRFLMMMGDQIYETEGGNVFQQHLNSTSEKRRRAFVELYQQAWSREPIRTILANTPTYMMGDDHDFRDGWGSWATDSPTLAARYPKGKKIADQYSTFFEDARDVFWHFQMCHNPTSLVKAPPARGTRQAMPVAFQCGRLAVLVLDNRGARDMWRESNPVLGDAQWKFISDYLGNLPSEIDAIAVVTPAPIVADSPNSIIQTVYGDQSYDVDRFKEGDAEALLRIQGYGREWSDWEATGEIVAAPALLYLTGGAAAPLAWDLVKSGVSKFKTETISDARDRWSHSRCRPEQIRLIREVGLARLSNRPSSAPRQAMFIGGDIHAGALMEITAAEPEYRAECLIASPIANHADGIIGLKVDEDFEVAEGIQARLLNFVTVPNFGVTHVLFGAGTPVINNSIAHKGDSSYWNLKLNLSE